MMVRHIVMFKIKEKLNKQEQAALISKKLYTLPDKIKEIRHYEAGINESGSERAFDLVLISEFDNYQALETYSKHPDHQDIVAFIKEVCEKTVVVDYSI